VLWLSTGSFLRVIGWGPREVDSMDYDERNLMDNSRSLIEDVPGGFVLVWTMDEQNEADLPVLVALHHIMTISPIPS